MNENALVAMEIGFNILYLVTIYILVALMYRRHAAGRYLQKNATGPFLLAFLLLAVGDTCHVGFRVAAYALGGLESHAVLVGIGALATAVTVTLFYMLMIQVWQVQTGKPKSASYWAVMVLGAARLLFMTLPGNRWGQVVPPLAFSYMRNGFLTVMGIIVAVQFLRISREVHKKLNLAAGVCVLISYAFYLPVILFIRSIPILGMLMIPKTLAYVALAVAGYRFLFDSAPDRTGQPNATGALK